MQAKKWPCRRDILKTVLLATLLLSESLCCAHSGARRAARRRVARKKRRTTSKHCQRTLSVRCCMGRRTVRVWHEGSTQRQ